MLSARPQSAEPNPQELQRWGVKAAISAVDGSLRQIYPLVARPASTLGTPVIGAARDGGLAITHTSAALSRLDGLHRQVDNSTSYLPLCLVARFDRIGPSTEFDAWGGVIAIAHGTNAVLSVQRSSTSTTLNLWNNNSSTPIALASWLASERTNCVLVAQSFGTSGRDLELWCDGVLQGSGTSVGVRNTGTTDLRLIVNGERTASASAAASSAFRDAFILNRRLSAAEIREISQPGDAWRFYGPPRRFWYVPLSGGGGQSVSIGQASYAESAFGMVALRTHGLGLAVETDAAQAVTKAGAAVAIGLASETDDSFALVADRLHAVGLTTETDAVLAMAWAKALAIGLAAASELAQALAAAKALSTGLASETEAGQAFARLKTLAVGLAAEDDSALAATAGLSSSVGVAAELDSAFAHTARRACAVDLVLEVDAALAATARRTTPIGLSAETDAALAAAHAKLRAIALATEDDAAQALVVVHIPVLGIAVETDLAFAMTALQAGGLLLGVRLLVGGASRIVHLKGAGTLH